MGDLLKWLSENPRAAIPVIIVFGLLLTSAVLVYMIAFFQGREISFWPPKIGSKPPLNSELTQFSDTQKTSVSTNEIVGMAFLRTRSDIKSLDEQTETASEIVISAISAVSLIGPNFGLFKRKLQDGCRLRVLLLDPESQAVDTWNLIAQYGATKREIEATLQQLGELTKLEKYKGQCEVRLAPVFSPFSMFIVDSKETPCHMIVEYHAFSTPVINRPHVQLTRGANQKWFDFYMSQFEQIWSEAKCWYPHHTERVGP